MNHSMAAVMITGVGLVSSHGEGEVAHVPLLAGDVPPVLATATNTPHTIHPLPKVQLERFIPRREMRQMEPWQRIGVHAAGLAIEQSGLKPRVAEMDLTVAAGGGERDEALDLAVMAARPDAAALNAALPDGMRPTLFLAQLPNLLAGSISITHGVAGSSRTMMGEEIAGAEALRIAQRRIAEGRSLSALSGAAMTSDRAELLLLYALGGHLHDGPWEPLPRRRGMVLGGVAAFVTLEPEGANPRPLARLTAIETDQGPPGGRVGRLAALLARIGPAPATGALLISTASGALDATREELEALPRAPDLFAADLIGHSVEAAFPAGVALGVLAIQAGRARRVLVTGCGQWRGEAVALLEAP